MTTSAYISFTGEVIVCLSNGQEISMGQAPRLPGEQVIIRQSSQRPTDYGFPYEFPLTLS